MICRLLLHFSKRGLLGFLERRFAAVTAMLMSTPYTGCSEVINRLQTAEIRKYASKNVIATYCNSLNKYIYNIYQICPNTH